MLSGSYRFASCSVSSSTGGGSSSGGGSTSTGGLQFFYDKNFYDPTVSVGTWKELYDTDELGLGEVPSGEIADQIINLKIKNSSTSSAVVSSSGLSIAKATGLPTSLPAGQEINFTLTITKAQVGEFIEMWNLSVGSRKYTIKAKGRILP